MAILEEMRPTVGIQKQKDRAQSLPEHSKTKISSSIKLNKKDLDVVSKNSLCSNIANFLIHQNKEYLGKFVVKDVFDFYR